MDPESDPLAAQLAGIRHDNVNGADVFSTEIDDGPDEHQVTYSVWLRGDGPALQLWFVPRSLDGVDGVAMRLDRSPLAIDALAPRVGSTRVPPAAPPPPDAVPLARHTLVRFQFDVRVRTAALEGVARVQGAWELEVRQWGPRACSPHLRIVRTEDPLLAAALLAAGAQALGNGGFDVTRRAGLRAVLVYRSVEGGVVIELDHVEVRREVRTLWDDKLGHRGTAMDLRTDLDLNVVDYELDPDITHWPQALIATLRRSVDPRPAARAALLIGEQRIADARDALVSVATDGDDDAAVRQNALWALTRLGRPADAPALAAAALVDDALSDACAKVALRLDPVVVGGSRDARLTALFERILGTHPWLANPTSTVGDGLTLHVSGPVSSMAADTSGLSVATPTGFFRTNGQNWLEPGPDWGPAQRVARARGLTLVAQERRVLLHRPGAKTLVLSKDAHPSREISLSSDGELAMWCEGEHTYVYGVSRRRDVRAPQMAAPFAADGIGSALFLTGGQLVRLHPLFDSPRFEDLVACPGASGLAASPSEELLAALWRDHDVGLAGRKLRPLRRAHDESVTCACFSDTGDWLATGDAGGVVVLWDVRRERPHARVVVPEPVRAVAWRGEEVAVLSGADRVRLFS